MYISCRLIKLSPDNSFDQLKYLGKIECASARSAKIAPMILRFRSIFIKNKDFNKGGHIQFLFNKQLCIAKCTEP